MNEHEPSAKEYKDIEIRHSSKQRIASPNLFSLFEHIVNMRLPLFSILFSLSLSAGFSLAAVYTQCTSPIQELQIRNRLSIFAQAIDFDNYPLLNEVFTKDVNATFDNSGTLYRGLDAIISAYEPFRNITSQISISTVVVNCTNQKTPQSVSYFTAANFISPKEVSFSNGKYFDTWSEVAKETWKISLRRTSITVSTLHATESR